jgi:hypothetical protein
MHIMCYTRRFIRYTQSWNSNNLKIFWSKKIKEPKHNSQTRLILHISDVVRQPIKIMKRKFNFNFLDRCMSFCLFFFFPTLCCLSVYNGQAKKKKMETIKEMLKKHYTQKIRLSNINPIKTWYMCTSQARTVLLFFNFNFLDRCLSFCLCFFFPTMCCLSVNLRLLITPLVSSNFSLNRDG